MEGAWSSYPWNDGYEPEAAIENIRELIAEHRVFALIGAVGTPTARSSVPVAAAAGVPYIAPFTGAPFLRDGQWQNVINLRASYYQETEAMLAFLTGQGLTRVAVAYQDDSFGRAGFSRRSTGARTERPGTGRHGSLSAQHDRGEDHSPGRDRRRPGGRNHRGGARAGRGFRELGPAS